MSEKLLLAILVVHRQHLSAYFAFNYDLMAFVMQLRYCYRGGCPECTEVLLLNWILLKYNDFARGPWKCSWYKTGVS